MDPLLLSASKSQLPNGQHDYSSSELNTSNSYCTASSRTNSTCSLGDHSNLNDTLEAGSKCTSLSDVSTSLATNQTDAMDEIASNVTPTSSTLKRECILDHFPWLKEVIQINQQCLGSVIELTSNTISNAMDFLIR